MDQWQQGVHFIVFSRLLLRRHCTRK